jgi:hypothetical protein
MPLPSIQGPRTKTPNNTTNYSKKEITMKKMLLLAAIAIVLVAVTVSYSAVLQPWARFYGVIVNDAHRPLANQELTIIENNGAFMSDGQGSFFVGLGQSNPAGTYHVRVGDGSWGTFSFYYNGAQQNTNLGTIVCHAQ